MAAYIIRNFPSLTLDQMNNVLAELIVLRDEKLYKSRNYAFMETESEVLKIDYIWAKLYRLLIEKLQDLRLIQKHFGTNRSLMRMYPPLRRTIVLPRRLIVYLHPRRGDLELLCTKYNIKMNEFCRGNTWIFLKNIIIEWYRTTAGRQIQLEITESSVMQKDHENGGYKYVSVPDYGFDVNGKLAKFLNTLGQVCKEWRVVLKSMCVWWGPDGRDFGFAKGSIDPPKHLRMDYVKEPSNPNHANDYSIAHRNAINQIYQSNRGGRYY